MKKGILITLLSALAGGLTAYAVVQCTMPEGNRAGQQVSADGSLFSNNFLLLIYLVLWCLRLF